MIDHDNRLEKLEIAEYPQPSVFRGELTLSSDVAAGTSTASFSASLDTAAVGRYCIVNVGSTNAELCTADSVTAFSPADGTNFSNSHSSGVAIKILEGAILNVLDFGATGDGSTNDATAIQATADAAATIATADKKTTLYFPPGYDFAVSSAVTVEENINVIMRSRIKYTGSSNITVLTIGSSGQNNRYTTHIIDVRRSTVSDWSSTSNIGVRFYNLQWSNVTITRAWGFTIGVELYSQAIGVVHNHFNLGLLIDNAYGLVCTAHNTSSWVNENIFLNGEFQVSTSTHTANGGNDDITGIWFRTVTGTYNHNNNLFLKPSFQMNGGSTSGDVIPVQIDGGYINRFEQMRFESGSSTGVIANVDGYRNTFSVGTTDIVDMSINEDGDRRGNTLIDLNKPWRANMQLVFDSGPIHKTACYYDGSSYVHVPRCNLVASSGATVFSNLNSVTLGDDYLTLATSRGIGVFVDTTRAKQFVVRRDVESSNPGRIFVRCYDSSDNVLNSGDSNHPYARGDAGALTYNSGWGNVYGLGSDLDGEYFFELHDDVAYALIFVSGGTSEVRLRSFKIYSVDNPSTTWAGYEEIVPGSNIATNAPSSGTWSAGHIVWDATPSASGYAGWICVAGGTPGTWKAWGAIVS